MKIKNLLGEVHNKHHFKAHDGSVIKSYHDLYSRAAVMNNTTFKHHVTPEKNDFANWVADVHRDTKLAKKLKKAKSQKEMERHMKNRINELNSIAHQGIVKLHKLHIKTGVFHFGYGLLIGLSAGIVIATVF